MAKKSLLYKLREKFTKWLTYEANAEEVMPYDFDRLKHEIRMGDVLLIEGRSRVSSVIRAITQSPWTHSALYIGRLVDLEDEETKEMIRQYWDGNETTRLVVEDLMEKGTIITPLSHYRTHHIRICRPIGITPDDLEQVIRYAVLSLGKPYNIRHFVDLARFLLPWTILPRRWGSSLFLTSSGEPESGICSSHIAEAFSTVQFPILPYVKPLKEKNIEVFNRNPFLYTPKDFDYSPYFEIIKYPLFNPDEPLPYYRRLPWSKSGMLHHDHGIIAAPKKRTRRKFFGNQLPNNESSDDDKVAKDDNTNDSSRNRE